MSQVVFGVRHLASSSHQAASNCGPRKLSGSSAEKAARSAPFGQSSRRGGLHCGRSAAGATASSPDTPSIITSRTSAMVSPIERDAPDAPRRDAAKPADGPRHPFGAGARLARAAPAEEQPGVPGRVLVRRHLMQAAAADENPIQLLPVRRRQAREELHQPPLLRQMRKVAAQAPPGKRWSPRRWRVRTDDHAKRLRRPARRPAAS